MSNTKYNFSMPFKSQNMTQSQFVLGRSLFKRTVTKEEENKNYKTQNKSRDSFGRLNALTKKSARSSLAINGVEPSFKNVDNNYVNTRTRYVRNAGTAVPKNAIIRN
jgi:hypothetical protein